MVIMPFVLSFHRGVIYRQRFAVEPDLPRAFAAAPASAFSSVDFRPFSPAGRGFLRPTVNWALFQRPDAGKLFASSVTFSKGCDISLLLLMMSAKRRLGTY